MLNAKCQTEFTVILIWIKKEQGTDPIGPDINMYPEVERVMGEEVADSEDFEISPNSLGPVGTVNNVQVPLPSTGIVNNVQVPSQKISGHMRSHGHRKNNRPTSKVAQHYSGQKTLQSN